jgi:hypothetical protein
MNPTLTSPPVWVTIGEPLEITFSDKNMFDDITNLQSTAKEFLIILPDPGILTVNLNRVSSDPGQAALRASYANGTRLPYQVLLPKTGGQVTSGDVYTFLAYVEQFSPEVKTDKHITTVFHLRITGPITFTVGS